MRVRGPYLVRYQSDCVGFAPMEPVANAKVAAAARAPL